MKNMSRQNDTRIFNQKLSERESEYLSTEQLRVFCGTYNVNGKSPDEDVRSWLFPSEKQVDVYAIGFQEVVDLSTTSYLLQSDWAEREQKWINAIDAELCINNSQEESNFNQLKSFLSKNKKPVKYRRIVKYRMFGLLLLIYVSEKLGDYCVSEIFTSEVPTGIMETLGNKGSVGVSFKLNETRLCFVCSHFASDTNNLQKRNSDFRSTKQRMKFEYNANLDFYDLDAHDIIFWFGDLNYRLDKISLNKTIEKIYTNEMDKLIDFDQLTIEMSKFNVFEEYSEGKINFRPTYKYLVKQDIYEKQQAQKTAILNNDYIQQSDHDNDNIKMKLPSWTDRILWKSPNSNIKVNLIQYSCINTITISDHKPVYALFDADVKKIDEKKFNKIYDSLLKDSDRKVNEEMPKISVEKFDYKFFDCKFYDQKSFSINVKNDGVTRSNVDIQFYDPNFTEDKTLNEVDDNELSLDIKNKRRGSSSLQHKQSQWCTINPQHKERIDVGSTYKVEVSTNFSKYVLKRFNKNHNVDDFLIVRCLNGNDIFVTLTCEYKPTIIGYSLKTLSALEKPFIEYEPKELTETYELQLENFEKNIKAIWIHSLKFLSAETEKKNAENLFGDFEASNNLNNKDKSKSKGSSNGSSNKPSKTKFYSESNQELIFENAESKIESKTELYKTLLLNLKDELVDKDEYFMNDLSYEYTFFMQYLIDKCTENLNKLNDDNEVAKVTENSNTDIKIEDKKNLVLTILSEKDSEKFQKENFDLELLSEVLYDLLYALPNPVIPIRFLDMFMYITENYEETLKMFEYIPKSHFKLFEMLIKFLQIYLKCLDTCNSNFDSLIANAVFQINPAKKSSHNLENQIVDKDFYKSQTANKLVKLFIENHQNFKLI